jgi:hypothetical protein
MRWHAPGRILHTRAFLPGLGPGPVKSTLIIGVSYKSGKKFYDLKESPVKKKHAKENDRYLALGKNLHPLQVLSVKNAGT